MAGVAPDERRGRRLPQWSLGLKAPNEVKRPNNGSDKSCMKKELAPKACQLEADVETQQPEKAVRFRESSCSLAKSETKRRKRKSSPHDTNHNVVVTEVVEKKKYNKIGRKARETAYVERKKAKRLRNEVSEGLDISSPSDDDLELTVKDLISIAEEYVQADKEMEQQRSSSRECESERHISMTTSSRIGCGGSLGAPSNEASRSSTETSMREKSVTEASITGDPTKDMLDLFLGPLLKKPQEEKRAEFKAIDDYVFSHDLKMLHQNENVGEEMVPLMKKKSSLRDKIALFLD